MAVTGDNLRHLAKAMESLALSNYSDTPSTWDRERYYFNEGARAAARLLARHVASVENHEESARAKRLATYFGVG